MAASIYLQDWPLICAPEESTGIPRTSPLNGDRRGPPGKFDWRAFFPDLCGFPPRRLIRAWSRTWTCRTFSRLVPWSAELMNTIQCVFHTRPRAEMKEPGFRCQALRSSKSSLCFSKWDGPGECGVWFMRKAQDWLEGRESNWPSLFCWALKILPKGRQVVVVLSAVHLQEAQPNSKNPILSFDQASDKIVWTAERGDWGPTAWGKQAFQRHLLRWKATRFFRYKFACVSLVTSKQASENRALYWTDRGIARPEIEVNFSIL